jgi:hypothetical protein
MTQKDAHNIKQCHWTKRPLHILDTPSEPLDAPRHRETARRAECVKHNVCHGGLPLRNEDLVGFIRCGVERRQHERQAKPPAGRVFGPRWRAFNHPPNEYSQNRVFHGVSGLPDAVVDQFDGFFGHVRVQPQQNRTNKPRGVGRRSKAGGSAENDNHPYQGRSPVQQEAAQHPSKGTVCSPQKQRENNCQAGQFLAINSTFMRILNACCKRLVLSLILAGLPLISRGADPSGNVVLQYHFLGASKLADNTNVNVAHEIFSLRSSMRFENLVMYRMATNFVAAMHWSITKETPNLLHPLEEDLLRQESLASLGGSHGQPLDFVLAIHLDPNHSRQWQQTLATVAGSPGQEFRAETFAGRQWTIGGGNDPFWIVPAGEWLVVGRGSALSAVRSEYLQQIQKSGRPVAVFDKDCFQADIDWPRLSNWLNLSFVPLKPGRMKVDLNASRGSFHMNCKIAYGEPIQWRWEPWRLPTNMVRQPLISFIAAQDPEPFLKPDNTLWRMATDPLQGQFLFWSMGEMPYQSYMAWPVADGTNIMRELSTQVLNAFNPKIKSFDGTELLWEPKRAEIVWTKVALTSPSLHPVNTKVGPFLLAELFPLSKGTGPAPEALWSQFKDRSDLVYYDWEYTGPRIQELRTITQTLPILQALGMGPNVIPDSGNPKAPSDEFVRLRVNETWLNGLASRLQNTVTEATKTGPSELTIVRSSPLVFSSLELVVLSHWLTDSPAGPVNKNLLPQAKVTGPGIPTH